MRRLTRADRFATWAALAVWGVCAVLLETLEVAWAARTWAPEAVEAALADINPEESS
jgi:hypothetical protein